jgi:hypothetical protein
VACSLRTAVDLGEAGAIEEDKWKVDLEARGIRGANAGIDRESALRAAMMIKAAHH